MWLQSWSSYTVLGLPISLNLMEALIQHPYWAHMLLLISITATHILGVPDWDNYIILLNFSNITNDARYIGRRCYSLCVFAVILWLSSLNNNLSFYFRSKRQQKFNLDISSSSCVCIYLEGENIYQLSNCVGRVGIFIKKN